MTTKLYTDTENVRESLELAVENHDEGRLTVVDVHPARVVALTSDEVDRRNLDVTDHVCVIEFELLGTGKLRMYEITLSFHESEVSDSVFELTPAGPSAIAHDGQATDPRALCPRIESALNPVADEEEWMFTFKEVSAASIGGAGHFTDFEFEYAIDGVSLP